MGTINMENIKPIEFVWRVLSFIPYQTDFPEPKLIREELTPSALENMKVYWSVAERLADMRWVIDYRRLAEEVSQRSEPSKDEMSIQYIALECYLHRIVATIGSWARTCIKVMKRLQKCSRESNTDIEHNSMMSAELKKPLMRIVSNIQRIVPKWDEPDTNIDEAAYIQLVWEGLQDVANRICGLINRRAWTSEISIATILSGVENVATNILGIGKNSDNQINAYLSKGTRCIALLETDDVKIMAFSGFWDCSDITTQKKLNVSCDRDLVDSFKRISNHFGADLAVLSTSVVERLHRYTLDAGCNLKKYGPLWEEIALATSNRMSIGEIKRLYSCCERKILAELSTQGKLATKSAILYVKFVPCLSCYGALREWVDTYSIQFYLDCPRLD